MNASSLPMASPPMPAGFATFLANIGQVSGGGDSGGFDQLLAAAPAQAAAVPVSEALVPQPESSPTESGTAAEIPVVKADPVETDAAAQVENLLLALNGGAQGTIPAPGKPIATDTEAGAKPDTADAAEAPVDGATTWTAIVAAAVPVSARTAKPVDAAAKPADTQPTLPLAAKPRDAASTQALAVAAAEAPVTKPADAAPSMTILFAQPATPAATALTDITAPSQVTESVLDMDSDGAWIDQLARDIAATKSDSGDISFRLMPRHLGRLDVAMQMGDDGVALKMDTHHEATATIVNAAQGRLVEELRQQGVRVAGAEVTCTPGETGRQSQNQGQGRTAGHDTAHLIETATERAEPRDEGRAAERRGRFA